MAESETASGLAAWLRGRCCWCCCAAAVVVVVGVDNDDGVACVCVHSEDSRSCPRPRRVAHTHHLAATEFLSPRMSGGNAVRIPGQWIRFLYTSFRWTVSVKPPAAAKWDGLVFQEGEVDRGADISPLSYYPQEREKLYGALSMMQV